LIMGAKDVYIVSACLVGLKTRYDGSHAKSESLIGKIEKECFLPICPEQLGGLSTPRVPAVIEGGDGLQVLEGQAKVINGKGIDVSKQFLKGAYQVLKMAKAFEVTVCYLKDGSPSCGVHFTSGNQGRIPGCGVMAALLKQEGFKIVAVE